MTSANSKRRRIGAGFPCVAAAVLAAACGTASDPDPSGASAARGIRRGDFSSELLLTGELRAVRSIEIKAPQTSQFQMRVQFMAEEGSVVQRGDALLDFDNSGLAEQVQELESRILDAETQIVTKRSELASALKDLEIELAEREYDHERAALEATIDPVVVSRKEFGERKLAFESAGERLRETRERVELTRRRGQSELDVLRIDRDKLEKDLLVARQSVERLSIKAPADGLVIYEPRPGTTLRFQEGDSCWPGQGVMRLPDLSEMQVEFAVSEVDAAALVPGMPLSVRLDAFPEGALTGTILSVPSMAVKRDETSKVAVFKVLAGLSETWPGRMKPGMSARGSVVLHERRDAPLVSREDVRHDGERYLLRLSGVGGEPGREEPIVPLARNARDYLLSDEDHARVTAGQAPQARPASDGAAS